MNKATVTHGWELHLVNNHLFITSEQDTTLQVHLNPVATSDLLQYLYEHKDNICQAAHQEEARETSKQ